MRKTLPSMLLGGCLAAAALYSPTAEASIALPAVVSANPANFTPNVLDDAVVSHTAVYALGQSGDTMYSGGTFHTVANSSGTQFTRNNLFSFSATSGTINAFAPNINGAVWGVNASPSALYVGGTFTTVDGVARRGIAKLDPITGAVDTSFNAGLKSGSVTEVRLVNGRLIIGGTFPGKLLALNPATGANTGYINVPITGTVASNAGATDVYRFAVDPAGTRLVALGNFTTVGGQPRSRAFMLDLGATSASLASWYYQPLQNMCQASSIPQYLRDVDFSPNGDYFVFVSTGYVPQFNDPLAIGRDLCDATARFETNNPTPTRPTWINYTGGDTLHSLAVAGSAVYVQGHQRWLDNAYGNDSCAPGCAPRPGIGAIDPNTGKALSWNPTKTRAVGGKDLLVTPAGLWVGSDGARIGGELRDNIGFMPL